MTEKLNMQNDAKTCRERARACDTPLTQPVPVTTHDDPRFADLERQLYELLRKVDMEWAYFVKSGKYVKIGHSRSSAALRQRLQLYKVAAPEGARLIAVSPGGEATERMLHAKLEPYRARGEWFRLTKPVLSAMRYEGLWPAQAKRGWPFRITKAA